MTIAEVKRTLQFITDPEQRIAFLLDVLLQMMERVAPPVAAPPTHPPLSFPPGVRGIEQNTHPLFGLVCDKEVK